MVFNAEKRDKRDVRSTLKSERETFLVRNISIVAAQRYAASVPW